MSNYTPDRPNPSTAELNAARILLAGLGLTAEDLLDAPVPRPAVPTFRDYLPIMSAGVRPGTRRVYSSYWNRIDKHWGERPIDEPTPTEIRQLLVEMQSELVIRRSGRGGHSATEHMIATLRCLLPTRRRRRPDHRSRQPREESRQAAPTTIDPPRRRRHPTRRDRQGGGHHR